MLDPILQKLLHAREKENNLRKLSHERGLIDFTSNDYLGLARSDELYESILKKTQNIPHRNGATGSRLLSGNDEYTEEVEHYLSKVFRSQAALIFNSGYAANQAVLSSLPQRGDTILYDELAHACMRDGAKLSLATRLKFRHNDLNDLEVKLKKASGVRYIAVESIYSMDGDECPLYQLVALADQYNAIIILDEAHSTGVIGLNGSGLAASLQLEHKIPVRIYTFGKAMGIHGACVVGSETLTKYLINFGKTFIFSTGLPPHAIVSIECAFKHLEKNITLQNQLQSIIQYFIRASDDISNKLNSKSQIQGIVIPGNEQIKRTASRLQNHGFDVRPILSPTVAKGQERLRICLHTFNSETEIDQLIHQLSN